MKTLLKNARVIKMIDDTVIFANIVIEDDRIKYIGDKIDKYKPFDVVYDCLIWF